MSFIILKYQGCWYLNQEYWQTAVAIFLNRITRKYFESEGVNIRFVQDNQSSILLWRNTRIALPVKSASLKPNLFV